MSKTLNRSHPLRSLHLAAGAALLPLLWSCAGDPMQPSAYHLGKDAPRPVEKNPATPPEDSIPPIVNGQVMPPRPRNGPSLETYSVVVNDVNIRELLFAMARDARIDVDVHPAVQGRVSLNAIDQTLPQILTRLARQIDIRYEFDGRNLVVSPDLPFVRHYTVDYVNISRDASANTSIATQISSTGRDALSGTGGGGQLSNNSTTQISNTSHNRFWASLIGNLRSLLDDGHPRPASHAAQASGAATDGPGAAAGAAAAGGAASGSSASGNGNAGAGDSAAGAGGSVNAQVQGSGGAGASSGPHGGSNEIIASPETGIMSVRATQRQHERVREYLDKVLNSARRQVMIEATIAEVQLSEEFQQGVNWSRIRADGTGWSFLQQPGGPAPLSSGATPGSGPGGLVFNNNPGAPAASFNNGQNSSMGVLSYLHQGSNASIGAAVSLLQSFGKVKVLSSPKISVLNNQTAVLKVVDNKVYFTIGVQITPGTATTAPLVTYTSTPNTVPVGFVMAVTPQIEETGSVTMNVRPTISRITGYVTDPNPALANSNVTSRIPEIQTREIESILKVTNGDVAVMGGLMQESVNNQSDGIPGAQQVPLFGNLFKYRNDASRKSELVIFLRPIVVKDASIEGDYKSLKGLQPGPDFFTRPDGPSLPQAWIGSIEAKIGDAKAGAGRNEGERRTDVQGAKQ